MLDAVRRAGVYHGGICIQRQRRLKVCGRRGVVLNCALLEDGRLASFGLTGRGGREPGPKSNRRKCFSRSRKIPFGGAVATLSVLWASEVSADYNLGQSLGAIALALVYSAARREPRGQARYLAVSRADETEAPG